MANTVALGDGWFVAIDRCAGITIISNSQDVIAIPQEIADKLPAALENTSRASIRPGDTVRLAVDVLDTHRCPPERENNFYAKVSTISGADMDHLKMDRDLNGCLYWNIEDVVLVRRGGSDV